VADSRATGVVGERLTAFADIRAATLAKLERLSQAQLDFSARRGRWSIGEVAEHLRLAEHLWRDEVGRLVALARAGKPARLKHTFAEINVSPLHIPDAVLSMLETPFTLMNRFVPDAVIGFVTEFPILPTRNPDFATPRPGLLKAELLAGLRAGIARCEPTWCSAPEHGHIQGGGAVGFVVRDRGDDDRRGYADRRGLRTSCCTAAEHCGDSEQRRYASHNG